MLKKILLFIFPKKFPTNRDLAITALGIFLGLGSISYLAYTKGNIFLIPPFGASAVLIYAARQAPMARPRNLIGGHLLSALIAITCCNLFSQGWLTITLIVILAILAMALTDTLHPPGGATALLCAMEHHTDPFFLFDPLGVGLLMLYASAKITAPFSSDGSYPYKPPGKKA